MEAYATPSAGPSRTNTRLTLPPMMIYPTAHHHPLNEYHHRLPSLPDQEDDTSFGSTSASSYNHHHPFHTHTPPSEYECEYDPSPCVIRSDLAYPNDPILPPSGTAVQSYPHHYPDDPSPYPPQAPNLSISLLLAAAHAATDHPDPRSQSTYPYPSPITPRPGWQHSSASALIHPPLSSERPLSPPHTPNTALSAPYDSGIDSTTYAVYRTAEGDEFQQTYHSPPSDILCHPGPTLVITTTEPSCQASLGTAVPWSSSQNPAEMLGEVQSEWHLANSPSLLLPSSDQIRSDDWPPPTTPPALLPPPPVEIHSDGGTASHLTRTKRAPPKRLQTWTAEKPKQGKKKRSAGYVRPIIRHRKRVGQRLLDMLKNAPVPRRTPQMEVHRARCFPFAEMANKLSEWYGLCIEWPAEASFEMEDLRSTRRMRQDELDRLDQTLDTGLVRIRLADYVLEQEPHRATEYSYPSDGSTATDDPDMDVECDSEFSPKPNKKLRRTTKER